MIKPWTEKKIYGQVIWCSDVHLMAHSPSALQRDAHFLKFLDSIDGEKTSHLILGGDIFDFGFGHSKLHHQKFTGVGERLLALHQKGVKIVFIAGNHEFKISAINWPWVRFIEKGSYLLEHQNHRLLFCHGDELKAPWHYFLYKAITRLRLFSFCASLIGDATLDHFALNISAKSRKKNKYREPPKERILSSAENWLIREKADIGVFGHFHVTYHHGFLKDSHKGLLLCLPGWENPHFLTINEGQAQVFSFAI